VSALADTPAKVTTKYFFAPLRTKDMDTESSGTETIPQEEAVPAKTYKPPPIVLTSSANRIQLQKQQRKL
jgi:hypothetical protein